MSAAMVSKCSFRYESTCRRISAWERRAANGVMDGLLREDALQHAGRQRLRRAFPIRVSRPEAGVLAVVAAAALALAVLPNPMDQVLAQRQADHASQAKAASAIRDVQHKIAASATPAPVDPKVQKILSDAQQKIAQAPDPRQALQAITPAEQLLQQLSDPQTPARTSTAQNLNRVGSHLHCHIASKTFRHRGVHACILSLV